MTVPACPTRNARVSNDNLSLAIARLEAHCNKFRRSRAFLDLPCIGKAMRRLDSLELAGDPDDTAAGKLVGDAISASYAQINLRCDTRDVLRAPPLLELTWLCPGFKQTFRRGANDPANNKRRKVRLSFVRRFVISHNLFLRARSYLFILDIARQRIECAGPKVT